MAIISRVTAISRFRCVCMQRLQRERDRASMMCRRSSRRCMVMLSAPACSATSAACTGSGWRARRACRTVATWSTLTPSAIGSHPRGMTAPSAAVPARGPAATAPQPGSAGCALQGTAPSALRSCGRSCSELLPDRRSSDFIQLRHAITQHIQQAFLEQAHVRARLGARRAVRAAPSA